MNFGTGQRADLCFKVVSSARLFWEKVRPQL